MISIIMFTDTHPLQYMFTETPFLTTSTGNFLTYLKWDIYLTL